MLTLPQQKAWEKKNQKLRPESREEQAKWNKKELASLKNQREEREYKELVNKQAVLNDLVQKNKYGWARSFQLLSTGPLEDRLMRYVRQKVSSSLHRMGTSELAMVWDGCANRICNETEPNFIEALVKATLRKAGVNNCTDCDLIRRAAAKLGKAPPFA